MILYELSEISDYLPQPSLGLPSAPPPAPVDYRGIAVHWWTYALPTSNPELRFAPTIPIRTWTWEGVPFDALTFDRTDTPPATTIEQDRYVRHAVAIVAAHHEMPQPTTLLYEVRLGKTSSGTVAFGVRGGARSVGVRVSP